MTNERKQDQQAQRADSAKRDEDALATLLTLAGPRADIPLEAGQRIYANVRREWQRSTARTRTLRWAVPFAMAASVAIAIAVNVNSPPVVSAPVVGSIALVAGVDTTPYAVGDTIRVGDVLSTSAGQGVSVVLADDTSLRIAPGSELRVDAADEYALLVGQVYVDTGEHIYRDRRLTVITEGGQATDIGTQFSVSYADTEMTVAVREGRVDVTDTQSTYSTEAGNRLKLKAGEDAVVDQVAANDTIWDWAASLAPVFDIENETLLDFLKWAARETGRTLEFSGDDVRLAAMGIRLHGTLANLSPLEAAESILATTRFAYRIEAGRISIDW